MHSCAIAKFLIEVRAISQWSRSAQVDTGWVPAHDGTDWVVLNALPLCVSLLLWVSECKLRRVGTWCGARNIAKSLISIPLLILFPFRCDMQAVEVLVGLLLITHSKFNPI